ncbi:MAG: hypothetical protein LQ350_007451 [Teloschistes chrysophthalmus]|nr:MAG: hypothetical protein LQ350_007451 [Niorma chrysophthalma]
MWMQAYGIADGYLDGWVSNLHMHALYSRWDLLKDQNQIKFTATSSSDSEVCCQQFDGKKDKWELRDFWEEYLQHLEAKAEKKGKLLDWEEKKVLKDSK